MRTFFFLKYVGLHEYRVKILYFILIIPKKIFLDIDMLFLREAIITFTENVLN